MGFNNGSASITNVNDIILDNLQIHKSYTLWWQIEIMFKIWKSILKTSQLKKVKILHCQCMIWQNISIFYKISWCYFQRKHLYFESLQKNNI